MVPEPLLHDVDPARSEELAAAFLGGDLAAAQRQDFEEHLLTCEACWTEVELGRTGRHLAEGARELAPLELRDRLRSVIASAAADSTPSAPPTVPAATALAPRPRTHRLRRGALAALATAAALTAAVLVVPGVIGHDRTTTQPVAIAQAIAGFRAHELPGSQVPVGQAPDLTGLDLRPIGAAAGDVAGTTVTAFAYRDSAGRDLTVLLSRAPFPTALGARRLAGADGPWIATAQGVTVLCARSPHALLVLSQDRALVMATAAAMRLT